MDDPTRSRELLQAEVDDLRGRLEAAEQRCRQAAESSVSERASMHEQLLQTQKMEAVGRLAGGVAHDFNNLLQAMAAIPHVMRLHQHHPDEIAAAAAELERYIAGGAKLTGQLLLFSRKEPVRLLPLDLNQILANAASFLRRLLRENIELELSLAAGPLPLRADRWQLEQVLVNMAVNAADAMPEGGRLSLRSGWESGEKVWFEVVDTGHGIPEELLEKIFEPFFTTKAPSEGTGLGLAVVHGVVTQHGGSVSVSSRLGDGSTFRVTLPRASERPAEEQHRPATVSAQPGKEQAASILLVEDDDGVRQSLSQILAMFGYRVTAARTGEEAVSVQCDLLLADYLLPGISGVELAGLMRARWPRLPVILLSGYPEEGALQQVVSEGGIRFLRKPCDVRNLAEEIETALAGRS